MKIDSALAQERDSASSEVSHSDEYEDYFPVEYDSVQFIR
jgi:hypothetical protein